MIKLTDILKEGKVLLQSNDKDADSLSEIADFLVHGKLHNVFQFIPRKSVDLDKIDSLGDINVTEQLVKFAEKKTKSRHNRVHGPSQSYRVQLIKNT